MTAVTHSCLVSRRIPLLAIVGGALLLLTIVPRPVESISGCPGGARLAGAAPPRDTQQWCDRSDPAGSRVMHGPYVAWYADGRRKVDGAYRNGAKDGRWVFWHPNGRKREEGGFRNDREHSAWTRWYANGHVMEAGPYVDGTRQGRWTFWYEGGRRAREGEYRDGFEVGPWQRWNLKGEACDSAADRG